MKKTKKIQMLSLAALLAIQSISIHHIKAVDYAANEDYYQNVCSGIIRPSNTHYQECLGYSQYLKDKQYDLKQTQKELQEQINSVKANIEKLSLVISENLKKMSDLKNNIESMQNKIDEMNHNLIELADMIRVKEADIKTKKEYIIARMRSTQYQNTINPYIDFIMGASNFIDMINRVSIVSQLDKADKEKMDSLEQDILALEEDQKEVERQKELIEAQKKDMKKQLEEVEAYKKATEKLKDEFEAQESVLLEKMINNKDYMNQITANIPSFAPDSDIPNASNGFSTVVSGYKSAGTWSYPGGSYHGGMDIASYGGTVGSPIYAPFNGVVVMAHDGEDTYNSWGQGLFGGGNAVVMVGQVNGRTYVVMMAHMKKGSVLVRSNQTVSQGQQIGAMGSSGYSTGPHTHIELYDCGKMSIEAAYNSLASGIYFFGLPLSYSGSCEARGKTPCRARPENYIPY